MKHYQSVEMQIIMVETEDILTESLGNGGQFNDGSNTKHVSLWDESDYE